MFKFAIQWSGHNVQSRRFPTLEAAKEIADSDKHYVENSYIRDSWDSNYQILEYSSLGDGEGKIVYDSRESS